MCQDRTSAGQLLKVHAINILIDAVLKFPNYFKNWENYHHPVGEHRHKRQNNKPGANFPLKKFYFLLNYE